MEHAKKGEQRGRRGCLEFEDFCLDRLEHALFAGDVGLPVGLLGAVLVGKTLRANTEKEREKDFVWLFGCV